MVDVEAKDKILRAKIQLQKSNPFFAYLISHLNIEENTELKDSQGNKMESMCVDNHNNMFYSPKFVNKMTESQLTACLVHEVMHKALEHLERFHDREREPLTWNIATDITINNLLLANKFDIAIEGLILPYNNEIQVFGKKLKDLDKKTAEKIYDEIFSTLKSIAKKIGFTNSSNAGSKNKFGFDSHFFGKKGDKGKNGKGKDGQGDSEEKNWKKITSEAYTMAKNMGKTPLGVDRQIDELLNPKLDWKSLLYRHITNSIPQDYTYCMDKNTQIETKLGKVKLKDIQKGDIVLGYKNGKIVKTKVLTKFENIVKRKKYIIYTEKGSRIICSDEHRFLTDKGYTQTKDLNIGDTLNRVRRD